MWIPPNTNTMLMAACVKENFVSEKENTRNSFASSPNNTKSGLISSFAGKTQVMGEIKIALKKEMKTDGEQLIVEILQCRNITYKFKSPDHLPGLSVNLFTYQRSMAACMFILQGWAGRAKLFGNQAEN